MDDFRVLIHRGLLLSNCDSYVFRACVRLFLLFWSLSLDVVLGQNNCGKYLVLFSCFRNCFVLVGACQKTLRAQRLQENPNFRKALGSHVSPESPLDARK